MYDTTKTWYSQINFIKKYSGVRVIVSVIGLNMWLSSRSHHLQAEQELAEKSREKVHRTRVSLAEASTQEWLQRGPIILQASEDNCLQRVRVEPAFFHPISLF